MVDTVRGLESYCLVNNKTEKKKSCVAYLVKSEKLVLLETLASSQRVLKLSFFSLAFAFFSFRSSSARSFTYLSNTCNKIRASV